MNLVPYLVPSRHCVVLVAFAMIALLLIGPVEAQTNAVVAAVTTDASPDQLADLQSFNRRYNEIVSSYDTESFLDLYAERPWWIAPSERPSEGLAEPKKALSFMEEHRFKMHHTIDRALMSEDGSQAVLIGEAKATNDDSPPKALGTYLFVLVRKGERWKIIVDMFNQYQPNVGENKETKATK